jgi:hypothetical protein
VRRSWGPVVALVLVLSAATPVRAGGALLDLNQEFFVPGDAVRAYSSVWLKSAMGRLEDGPYFAYLSRASRRYPPPLPGDALRVASVEIEPRRGAEHGDAYVEFELPPVEPGRYLLTLCNDPCTITLGDIMPTEVVVAGDDAAGRVAVLRKHVTQRVRAIEDRLFDTVLGPHSASVRGRVKRLEQDVAQLEAELDELRGAPAPAAPANDDASSALPALLAFVLPAALAGVFFGRRSQRAT